jgi:phospholipase/lecithinase/hemolysin
MVFDTYSYLNGILDDPALYGIKNTTGYCKNYDAPDIATNYASYGCLPIQEFFWYNTGHITYRVHELLAEALGKFLAGEKCC